MRENRLSGSEGGGRGINRGSLPLSGAASSAPGGGPAAFNEKPGCLLPGEGRKVRPPERPMSRKSNLADRCTTPSSQHANRGGSRGDTLPHQGYPQGWHRRNKHHHPDPSSRRG